MTPLFACFPVCLTFVALGFLALLVIVTGMIGPGATPDPSEPPIPAHDPEPGTGPPSWWVVLLIFAAVGVVFMLLNWVAADS